MATKKSPAPSTPAPKAAKAAVVATEKRTKGHKARFIISLMSAQPKAKLTDEELAKRLIAEYPESERPWLRVMGSIRRHYNAGKFTGQTVAPKVQIPRYDSNGDVVGRGKPGPKAEKSTPVKTAPSKAPAKAAPAPAKKLVLKKKAD